MMVQFTNRCWSLCWIGAWQRRGAGWIVKLAWGDFGAIRSGWFHYLPEKVKSLGELDV